MRKMMNRVVRDEVPSIMKRNGTEVYCRKLDEMEMVFYLENELQHTIHNYMQSKDYEDLVDILEIVYALGERQGISKEELERTRAIKTIAKGSYKMNYFVEYIEEEGHKESID